MAYLAGSAFLEWLVARSGEESLPRLWRRMTARQDRDFAGAFFGVFGDTPSALYGRFTADLTGKALRAADDIAAAGLDSGETFQHLTWYTGDPALSHDGRAIAVPVRAPGRPTRIVVWPTTPAPPDSARAAAVAAMLARDPDDVAAVDPYPAPRQPIAVLEAARGIGYDLPRFFAGGDRVLVSHDEPLRDGALRPDLYEWNLRTRQVRRVTHGAAVRGADPAPDGRTAIGVRCLGGILRRRAGRPRARHRLVAAPRLAGSRVLPPPICARWTDSCRHGPRGRRMAPRDVCGGRQWRHRAAPDRPGGRREPLRRVVYGGR